VSKDLAVLRVDLQATDNVGNIIPRGVFALPLDTVPVSVGDHVGLAGYPQSAKDDYDAGRGLSPTFDYGSDQNIDKISAYGDLIHPKLDIEEGYSGGPVFRSNVYSVVGIAVRRDSLNTTGVGTVVSTTEVLIPFLRSAAIPYVTLPRGTSAPLQVKTWLISNRLPIDSCSDERRKSTCIEIQSMAIRVENDIVTRGWLKVALLQENGIPTSSRFLNLKAGEFDYPNLIVRFESKLYPLELTARFNGAFNNQGLLPGKLNLAEHADATHTDETFPTIRVTLEHYI